MAKTRGHSGYVLKRRPRRYSATPQQERFQMAVKECGIEKGISKTNLMLKMKNCLPRFFRREKNAEAHSGRG